MESGVEPSRALEREPTEVDGSIAHPVSSENLDSYDQADEEGGGPMNNDPNKPAGGEEKETPSQGQKPMNAAYRWSVGEISDCKHKTEAVQSRQGNRNAFTCNIYHPPLLH